MTAFPFIIDEPDSFLNPILAHTNNTYTGVYALDTFSVTDRLTVTGGGRFNYAGISIEGQNNALLNGYSNYFHVNPTVGFTYKLTPDINFYAGYAMTNRAPTPLELGCADPNNPCIIDNFLSSDPKLKQVVGQTFELGFRGTECLQPIWSGAPMGQAAMVSRAFPHDARPTTSCRCRARPMVSAITPTSERPCARARKSAPTGPAIVGRLMPITPILTPSIFRPSKSRRRINPLADANGNIPITNGTQIAGIPKNTVKVGVDYAVTDKWHVGADMVAASGQVIFGNENNAVPQVPGYAIFGLHTSYQVGKNFQIYGFAQNIFDQRYYTSGALVRRHGLPQRGAIPDQSNKPSGLASPSRSTEGCGSRCERLETNGRLEVRIGRAECRSQAEVSLRGCR